MTWVGRLFDERYTIVRITLLNLSGIGYVTIRPDGSPMNTVDIALAIGTFLFGYAHLFSPFGVVLGLSVAMGAGHFLGAHNDVVPSVGLAWGVLELGMRRSGWQVWGGVLLALAANMVSDLEEVRDQPEIAFYSFGIYLALPLMVGLQIRSLRHLNQQAAQRAAQESARVRAEERTSIARELHDLVAHHVASIVLRVGVARNVLQLDDPRVREVLDDVHSTASGALADLRRLVAVLRDPGTATQPSFVDPEGLSVALAAAVERSRQIGLSVDADIDPEVIRLDSRSALAVLRLAQEGLANVAKHAGTQARVRLAVRVGAEAADFELLDFGGEGAPAPTPNGGGHGLIGLRERVEVLGGTLDAGPVDAGWRLAARIPA